MGKALFCFKIYFNVIGKFKATYAMKFRKIQDIISRRESQITPHVRD